MHIIHLASELAPIAKVGGLADVVYGLCKELVHLGHSVEVILPKYDTLKFDHMKNLQVCYRELWSYDGPYSYNNTIWSCEVEGIHVKLIEPHHPHYFFHRGQIYGCDDDLRRFLYFTRASLEYLYKSDNAPDALHIHDWPVAAAAVLVKDMYKDLGMKIPKVALTLHNLEHQGKCHSQDFSLVGLKGEDYQTPDKLQDPQDPYALNLLKGGIVYSDVITTVSPTYEKEIKSPKGGHGLSSVLNKHASKLKGVLNGIDEDFWNPAIDPYLCAPFHATPPFAPKHIKEVDSQKKENKKALQKALNLSPSEAPLVCCISRLVHQKSPELIASAFKHTLKLGGQCVILGSTHTKEMLDLFTSLQESCDPNFGSIVLSYNEALSHLIYAGSDMIVIPSLFEPCGLTQMIALRYGTIPITRNTGGLKDTVFDIETSKKHPEKRNGFTFEAPIEEQMESALTRAIRLRENSYETWLKLRMQGMSFDNSWKKAAQKYLKLYH